MEHSDGAGVEEVEGEIAVARDIEAVARDAFEAEVFGDGFTVEGEAAAGEGSRTEGQDIGAAAGFAEALPIAREHLEVGEEVMRPKDGLGAPHVGVAGDDGTGIFGGEIEEAAHDAIEQSSEVVAFFAEPEAGIERHLLIAAATGVDLGGYGSGFLVELADDEVWTSSSVAPS